MQIVALILLLVPGLISVRILWYGKEISKSDYKFIVCDYFVYSFLILLVGYAIMFLSYPERSVSFSVDVPRVAAVSHILAASFVFKYGAAALASAVILPAVIPAVCKFWLNAEANRVNRAKKAKNSPKKETKKA
ncbi:MAG: hypothetical protein FWG68_02580 [Defluviitaleaceae bacterium]|nr:hypothetical protein [Defluviitaleaceae bacterium]